MDLDKAIAAHAEWKIKLRSAISAQTMMDAATIRVDNCCELGKWLHGDAKRLLSGRQTYSDLVSRHADFHRQAGRVADAINMRRFTEASAMLDAGTDYASASSAVGIALNRLKRELASA